MAGETSITLIGNLTTDPELRYTPHGTAVTTLTVASTPRHYDRHTHEWKDGDTLFQRCTIWRQPAEHAAETLTKGMRVLVHGRLHPRTFDTKDGDKRTVLELDIDEIGPSLRYATATITKTHRNTPNTNTTAPATDPSTNTEAPVPF